MASNIGRRVRHLRQVQGLSQAAVAGMAGITASYLSRIENGERFLNNRSTVNALANALNIAPTELAEEMVTERGTLDQDAYLPAVRQALMAVTLGKPNGALLDASTLAVRVDEVLAAQQQCQHVQVGNLLPSVIRDLHTTLLAHRDERQLLRLTTLLHLQGTQAWLPAAGAPADLSWIAATLGQYAAERLEEDVPRALAAFGTAHGLIASGSYELADETLRAVDPGTGSQDRLVMSGMLSLTASMLAAAKGDRGGSCTAPLEHARELAERVGESEPWFGFGTANVDLWGMSVALEVDEYTEVERLARSIDPEALPSPFRAATYWVNRGRAMSRLPRKSSQAVRMLRTAEKLSPARLHRNPLAVSTLTELLARAKHDAYGRELRGMAYRAGLPV